ncbi:alpha/beta hydrolase fold domain-containing protein [Streptomyces sp. NPDC055681]
MGPAETAVSPNGQVERCARSTPTDFAEPVSVNDTEKPYRYLDFRGEVVRIDDDSSGAFFTTLARRYDMKPPALVITGEADVLRDEGEAYANKPREAGVAVTPVRLQGIIHDFVMLNALRGTHAAEAAVTLAAGTARTALNAD